MTHDSTWIPVRRFALALGVAASLACGGDDGGPGTGPGPAAAPMQVTVNIVDFAFTPQVDTVAVGGTVTWPNTGNAPHTSTSTSSPSLWDSGRLSSGQSYSRQFADAGSFPYVCTIHPNMTGTIVAR